MNAPIQEIFISYAEQQLLLNNLNELLRNTKEPQLLPSSNLYGHIIRKSLNEESIAKIMSFHENKQIVSTVIRGLPIDKHLPATPHNDNQSINNTIPIAIAVNLGLYDIFNIFPVTYKGENKGKLFRHVIPAIQKMNEKSSHGSNNPLGMHVDNSYLPLTPELFENKLSACPEYLSLFGMRCNLNVSTKIAFLDNALETLDSETINQLKKPDYIFNRPDSFENRLAHKLPILVQDNNTHYFRFDTDFTTPINDKAQNAFNKLNDALLSKNIVKSLFLQPGDFLIFKNQRVSHSRESFSPRHDGTDRWLMRLFGVSDLDRTIPVDKSNPYHIVA